MPDLSISPRDRIEREQAGTGGEVARSCCSRGCSGARRDSPAALGAARRHAALAWPDLEPIELPPVSDARRCCSRGGSLALGALAVGALAIGALAIGRLEIRQARLRKVEIDELTVRRFRVVETPEPGHEPD